MTISFRGLYIDRDQIENYRAQEAALAKKTLIVPAAKSTLVTAAVSTSECISFSRLWAALCNWFSSKAKPVGKIDLVKVMDDTLRCIKAGFYRSPDGQRHALDVSQAVQGAKVFPSAGNAGMRPKSETTVIYVENQDCLYAAEQLAAEGLNPMVADLASSDYFGGGYRRGCPAQEEEICRRSTLSVAADTDHGVQKREFYPLQKHGAAACVHVPDVTVFKAGKDKGYAYLDRPFKIDVGIIAASRQPRLVRNAAGELRLGPKEAKVTREKIRTLLEMAYRQGNRSLVLGALGCGEYCNPPQHIAELFKDVIKKEYPGCFKKIVFGILDDRNAGRAHNPEGNFKPFKRVFNK